MKIKDVIYFCAMQKASGATPLGVQNSKKANGMTQNEMMKSVKMCVCLFNQMKVR